MNRHQIRSRRGDFDENSPRPPVPGEETVQPFKPLESEHAPYGYEPEGRCRLNYHEGTRSPPACLIWARNLHCLLADTEGVQLFRTYLEQEGRPHADALNFWFACEGLKKQTDRDRIIQIVKVIQRKFIASARLGIREDLRREVTSRIRDGKIDQGIFDAVQNEVGKRISDTTYPNFLKSDIYLNFVQQLPPESYSGSGSGSGSSSSSNGRDATMCGAGILLPTLHEDSELVVSGHQPLTRDLLAATQTRRALELRPKPEAFAGVYLQNPHLGPVRAYSSYNPVSRQDSELQSLSSDARTDSDAMSCTDSSLDGASINLAKQSKRYFQRQVRAMKESAHLNRDSTPYLIPRTQRPNSIPKVMPPEEFAQVLTDKLSAVVREREAEESLNSRLATAGHSQCLSDVIREKLQVDDSDADQAILDQHVSRVWSDLTPCRSPGRPKSPDLRRKGTLHGHSSRYPPRYPRKGISTLSTDSGNVHDFPEFSDSGRHFTKSKSVPENVDAAALDSRLRSSTQRRSSSKKTMGELTDSGVSVVSDSIPKMSYSPPSDWVKSWLNSDKHRPPKMQSSRHVRRERSSSLERNLPYAGDCMMPPMSAPHTATQLEEARRRLIEGETRGKMPARQRFPVAGKSANPMEASPSDQSTLKKNVRRPVDQQPSAGKSSSSSGPSGASGSGPSDVYTTVMYSFGEEQVPYLSKLPGRSITLRQFKESLPKRGNYRYYFKTECDEEDLKVILQEVTDDNEILPLWNGKLFAQVNPIE